MLRQGELKQLHAIRKVLDRVIKPYRERYRGFGPTLASEKLFEKDRIEVSDKTLRKRPTGSVDWEEVCKKGFIGAAGLSVRLPLLFSNGLVLISS